MLTDGSGADTITGGAVNDNITLVTGGDDSKDSDTVVFAATAAANGVDTITGFKAGAADSGGDVLNFAEFLGAAVGTGTTALLSSGLNLLSGNVGVTAVTGGTIDKRNIDTSASSGKVAIKDNAKAVVLVVDASAIDSSGGAVNIYYVQDINTATDAQIWDVQLVGKITNSIVANTFDTTNFA